MGSRMRNWMQQRALAAIGPTGSRLSRWATTRLCERLRTDDDEDLLDAVVGIACLSADGWAADEAMHALDARCDDPRFLQRVLVSMLEARMVPGGWHRVTRRAAALLMAPAPTTAGPPVTRLAWYLDGPAVPATRPGRYEVASWLVQATLYVVDDPLRRTLVDLLRATGQPDLLRALQAEFYRLVGKARRYGSATSGNEVTRASLWHGTRPAPLTGIVLANPHLPLEVTDTPQPDDRPPYEAVVSRVLIAILKGRPDPLPATASEQVASLVVTALLFGVDLWAPPDFVDACQRALRAVPPGPVREALCDRAALFGVAEARAAVVDAGLLPADERKQPAFLFLTGQWAAYDRLDPDGSRLRAWCAKQAAQPSWPFRRRFEEVAAAAGRASPFPAIPRPSSGSRRSIGSWVTDYGVGGHF
ncbi:hypothetical protein ONA91_27400 [Micromonospora sp. DR5-3]|uniref:hypothetical protein n=1 Tax=unclassified Micromonospora TaxID=2617518 RepID=UPI0011D4D8D3|nr:MULTISPECIES: hypothetical protein [unclassified Micromonospora]MCW3818182.1 hypothetical protein [Micromonospora sp. DR5-3]TYC21370.1 hypothetical protein FXF52_26425 [Micromonospora sp. MP36]